jgi:hypothetical protein
MGWETLRVWWGWGIAPLQRGVGRGGHHTRAVGGEASGHRAHALGGGAVWGGGALRLCDGAGAVSVVPM